MLRRFHLPGFGFPRRCFKGICDNDRAAVQLTGGKDAVLFKLGYVPPYEKFGELKRFQLRTKDAVLFCVDKVSVIVDISEWVGHENEGYFVATMKYLHNQTHKWRYIFTVGNYCFNAVKPMLGVIERYLHGVVHEENQPVKKESENNNELRL